MKKTLAAMLVALAIIGGVTLSRIDDGVTLAELSDAGFQQCDPVDLGCEVRIAPSRLAGLEDRGQDAGKLYRRVVMDGRDCRAKGLGLVVTDRRFYVNDVWVNGIEVMDGRCKIVANAPADDGGTGLRELPLECGCRKAAGLCRYMLPDGGLATAPQGRTLGPGYPPYENFAGAGCAKKACVEFSGEVSWPEDCPGG